MAVAIIPRRLHPLTDAGGAAPAFERREVGAETIRRVGHSNQWTPERIRELRMKLQLTQEEFAQLIGVTFPTVNRWENGKNSPNRIAQRRLAKAEEGKLTQKRAGLVLPDGVAPPLPEIVTFPTAVKWLRDRYDMTQEDFANGIGVTASTMNMWENGKRAPNKLAKMALLEIAGKAKAPQQIKEMFM